MSELFIEDLEQKTGVDKRKIYKLVRRREFYKKFGIKKMADLPDGTNNGSISKVLSYEQFEYLLEKINNGCDFREDDGLTEDEGVVYIADLCPGGVLEINGERQRRFKIGYTSNSADKREKDFKVTNPEAEIIMVSNIGLAEERVLLKYINGKACKRIGNTEVFNVTDEKEFLRLIQEFADNLK